ncbi:hypothetical protein BGW80DRAFT_916515 [Lactifluus volemus]|nr:hypothetical protein BGW80DRAFT_916515 [Lactifluus volemus]
MATGSPDSEVASPHPQQSSSHSTKLFDDPDADIILRSCDCQDFRVLRLYVLKSSPVLEGLIRAAASNISDAVIIPDAETSLPVVEMSERGAILSCLFTFTFPMSPSLPQTIEEIIELLSVAQKYKMSSVLSHIRGTIALQDLPFIRQENAFQIYSLARKHGLLLEATQAPESH